MTIDLCLILLSPKRRMSIARRRVITGFCIASPLAHDQGFIVADVPGGGIAPLRMLLIPPDVLVDANDIKHFAKRIVDDLVRAICSLFRADKKRRSDETSGIKLMCQINHRRKVFGSSLGVWRLVGNRPQNNRSLIAIAANHLCELLLRLRENRGVIELQGPVVWNVCPDQKAEAIGGTGHTLVVRIMRKADVVAAQFFRPPEKCLDVFFRVSAAGTIGSFGVNRDPAKKDRLAVQ